MSDGYLKDEAAGYTVGYPQPPATAPIANTGSRKSSMVFAILLILFEILFCLITGLLYRVRQDILITVSDYGGVLLVCILTILTVLGKF